MSADVWVGRVWWKVPKYCLHMFSLCLLDIQVEIIKRQLEIRRLGLSREAGCWSKL